MTYLPNSDREHCNVTDKGGFHPPRSSKNQKSPQQPTEQGPSGTGSEEDFFGNIIYFFPLLFSCLLRSPPQVALRMKEEAFDCISWSLGTAMPKTRAIDFTTYLSLIFITIPTLSGPIWFMPFVCWIPARPVPIQLVVSEKLPQG